jgi:hypothetical protein
VSEQCINFHVSCQQFHAIDPVRCSFQTSLTLLLFCNTGGQTADVNTDLNPGVTCGMGICDLKWSAMPDDVFVQFNVLFKSVESPFSIEVFDV